MSLLRRLPLNGVRAFHFAARHRSFAAAAEAMHLSPPALSEQIRLLEARIGCKLFERSSRGIELTPVGAELAREVAVALSRLEDAFARTDLGQARDVLSGTMLRGFLRAWFAPRIPALMRNSGVRLAVTGTSRAVDLFAEDFDFAIRYGPQTTAVEPTEDLEVRLLMDEPLVPAAAPGIEFSPDDLMEGRVPRIWTSSEPWSAWAAARQQARFKPAAQDLFINDSAAAVEAAIAGAGVLLARRSLIETATAERRLVPDLGLGVRTNFCYYLLTRQGAAEREPLTPFVARLEDQCRLSASAMSDQAAQWPRAELELVDDARLDVGFIG